MVTMAEVPLAVAMATMVAEATGGGEGEEETIVFSVLTNVCSEKEGTVAFVRQRDIRLIVE
jgi:hypothetical protein